VAALFAQTAFAPWLTIHGAMPSFVTIVVALYALRVGVRGSLLLGALAGLLTDIIAGTGGGWTLAYLAIVLLSGAVRSRLFADGIVSPSILVAGAVLLRNGVFWLVMAAEGYPRGYGSAHLHVALEQALLTGIATAIVQALRLRFGEPPPRGQRYA
jgi:rod shape-determining protein MreD